MSNAIHREGNIFGFKVCYVSDNGSRTLSSYRKYLVLKFDDLVRVEGKELVPWNYLGGSIKCLWMHKVMRLYWYWMLYFAEMKWASWYARASCLHATKCWSTKILEISGMMRITAVCSLPKNATTANVVGEYYLQPSLLVDCWEIISDVKQRPRNNPWNQKCNTLSIRTLEFFYYIVFYTKLPVSSFQ